MPKFLNRTIVLAPNVVVFFFDQYANTLLGPCNGLRSYQPTSCGCQGSVFLEWTILGHSLHVSFPVELSVTERPKEGAAGWVGRWCTRKGNTTRGVLRRHFKGYGHQLLLSTLRRLGIEVETARFSPSFWSTGLLLSTWSMEFVPSACHMSLAYPTVATTLQKWPERDCKGGLAGELEEICQRRHWQVLASRTGTESCPF